LPASLENACSLLHIDSIANVTRIYRKAHLAVVKRKQEVGMGHHKFLLDNLGPKRGYSVFPAQLLSRDKHLPQQQVPRKRKLDKLIRLHIHFKPLIDVFVD
jgi:hypothetical protein